MSNMRRKERSVKKDTGIELFKFGHGFGVKHPFE